MKHVRMLIGAVAILLLLYMGWLVLSMRDYRVGEPAIKEKFYKLLDYSELRNDWGNMNCSVGMNNSLGQSLHIVKEGNSVFCVEEVRGNQYNSLKTAFYCNSGDAKVIDEAVRKRKNCTFQLSRPLGNDVSNYHAFVLVCVADLTNWSYVSGGGCPSDYAQSVIYGVVDDKGNVFY